jgi:triacylglycerol lipase
MDPNMTIPKLRSPVVLVHGLLGFDRLKLAGWTIASYFCDLPENFTAAGNRVPLARLSPTDGIAQRAAELKAFLDKESPGEPVHLFAHSMGGLDSRYMISRLEMASRVLTLTSIATPHRGSSFADWGVSRFGRVAKPLGQLLDIPMQAFYDLTTTNCRAFNEQVPDAPRVRYFSVAGRHEGSWRAPEWKLSHAIVSRAEGPNDGMVSMTSATYGEDCQVWPGDHISLINWRHPVHQYFGQHPDRTPQYASLLQRLADEGF